MYGPAAASPLPGLFSPAPRYNQFMGAFCRPHSPYKKLEMLDDV